MTQTTHPLRRPRRVLVVDGHPRADSLCAALAKSYCDGAESAGHEVRPLALRDLRFDLNELNQALEHDVVESRAALQWAEHVTLVSPVWWGTMPALLKGWLDRVLGRGFAFAENADGTWQGLLQGRTGCLVLTMDTPLWVFRHILRAPAVRALRDATLGFCGIGPVHVLMFGPVRDSDAGQRGHWLDDVKKAGASMEKRFYTGAWPRFLAWLRIARLQFYVFPMLAVIAGAMAAMETHPGQGLWALVWLAVTGALLVEFITVLTNEIHDFRTDSANLNSGPFTGGSRVLVEQRLTLPQVRRGRAVALSLLGLLAGVVFIIAPVLPVTLIVLLALGLMIGISYTAPPMKLVCRGWGELMVAVSHSAVVVLAGYASQGGAWTDPAPWQFISPMFLAIFPSIILAGFPDFEADQGAGKNTLAVRMGKSRAAWLALVLTLGAAAVHLLTFAAETPIFISLAIIVHALFLTAFLVRHARRPQDGRINGLLALALAYMLWFVLGPLLRYWPAP